MGLIPTKEEFDVMSKDDQQSILHKLGKGIGKTEMGLYMSMRYMLNDEEYKAFCEGMEYDD